MAGRIEARLRDLGLELPEAPAPAGGYVPYVRTGNLLFIAGQLPIEGGKLRYHGAVGEDFSIEEGQHAARLCAINLIAQARAACAGDLDRIRRCVKLGGFVNCRADFADQPRVLNGASELMVEVFGEAGRHARFAVGSSSLPLGAAVEVDAVFEVA